MTYQNFRSLVLDAQEFIEYDQFIAECGGGTYKPMVVLPYVWAFAHSPTCKMIRSAIGMSQAQFSAAYGIPKRTIGNWESDSESGHRAPAATLGMLAFAVLSDLLGDD